MDIVKHLEFFDPVKIEDSIHIIGVGAIGSNLTETLTRLGLDNLNLYDFDTVTSHNIANQMFFDEDIEKTKLESIEKTCKRINPDINIKLHEKGWEEGKRLSGYVFLCVDNIEIRKKIVQENMYNPNIKAMFDFRMGLEDAQHYAANWSDSKSKETFYDYMDFTHEEAKEEQPVSACGTTLSVIPTIRTIVSLGTSNFINFIKKKTLKKIILIDAFNYKITTF